MYLRGSKWSMNRRRRSSNPLRVILLVILVGVALYINQVVVPATPPLFVPTPTPTRSPESFVLEAQKLVKEGKVQPAMAAYQEAIQSDPTNPSNYLELARLQVFAGKYKEAQVNAENALLKNPNNANAHAVRGWALSYQEEYLPAEAAFKKAIELDPNNAVAYAYYAEMLAQQVENGKGELGTLDKAIAQSRTAQNINPNLLEVHRARGIVLEQTGNYEEAVKEYQAAINVDANIADLHLALGRNYRKLEMYDKAIEEFGAANALNPTDPLPDTYISRTYFTVGEYAKAIQYAESAVKDAPQDPYMWGNLGVMLYHNNQFSDAVNPLKLAVTGGTTEDGKDVPGLKLDYGRIVEYYYTYGLTLAKLGNCGEALRLSQVLQDGARNDEIAVYNAQEMVNICEQVASGTAQPTAETTAEPGVDITPQPETTGTARPTNAP